MTEPSPKHLLAIARILEGVASVYETDGWRAVVACEDAYAVLALGASLNLSPRDVAAQHQQLMAQLDTQSEQAS